MGATLFFSGLIFFMVGCLIGFFVGNSVGWDAKQKLHYLKYIFGITKDFYVESSVELIFGKYWKKSER